MLYDFQAMWIVLNTPEVKKYLINVDGSDAGAYEDTDASFGYGSKMDVINIGNLTELLLIMDG